MVSYSKNVIKNGSEGRNDSRQFLIPKKVIPCFSFINSAMSLILNSIGDIYKVDKHQKIAFLLFSFLFLILIIPQSVDAFDNGFFWQFPSYSIQSSSAGSGLTNFFQIYDANLDGNGGSLDQLSVTVESKDSLGTSIETMSLILTEDADDGTFGIDHMVFGSEFLITNPVLISIEDPCDEVGDTDGNCDPERIEKLSGASGESVIIFSDTMLAKSPPLSPLKLDLVETGPDTGIFSGFLSFSTTISDEANSILLVSPGDVFTVKDQKTNTLTNGLISGNSNRFAIQVEVGGTVEVTATPNTGPPSVTDSTTITPGSGGGRGSGGLVNPGLVADSPSHGDSGCSECIPPTLGVNDNNMRIVENGFSFNDNPVNVELFYTPYPLVETNVGEENKVILKIYENSGPENIEHIGLGFGLKHGEFFSESKATINVDRTRDGTITVSTFDPETVFENISVESEIGQCSTFSNAQCMIFTIFHTFRESLNFNMVSTNVWDFDGNAWQNYYNHGIHIFGDSLNPPKIKSVAFGTHDMRGLFTLTQIDKFEDRWIDEFGNVYQHMGNDRFDKISSIPKKIVYDYVTMHGCGKLCNWFDSYKLNQNLLAKIELEQILMGKEIINEQKGFTESPFLGYISRSDDNNLQNRIKDEILKATELFDKSFDINNNF